MDSVLRAKFEQLQSKFQIHSQDLINCLRSPENEGLIYKHQRDALFAIKEYFDRTTTLDKPALVVAPTGAGKSGIVALLPYVLASEKALVLSPSLKITEQLEKAFGLQNDFVTKSFVFERKLIEDRDILKSFLEKGKVMRETENIQNMDTWNLVIVNAQKFGTNSGASLQESDNCDEEVRQRIRGIRENFDKFSTLIVDEAHHYPASTWDLIINEFKGRQIVFLTATPFRGSDRRELLAGQQITYSISKSRLIALGIIRNIEFRELTGELDYNAIKESILEVINQHDLAESSVAHKAIVLALNKDEAAEGARQMGNIASYHTSDKRTDKFLKHFENTNHKILFVCGKLIEGYDNSDISVCVILRNVGVLGLFTQFVGRCVRTSKFPDNRNDAVNAMVLSHSKYKQSSLFNDYMRDADGL